MTGVAADRRYLVSAQDRADCIDLVNRLNWAFDEQDLLTMMASFTEDCTVQHPRGSVRGHAGLRPFFDTYLSGTQGVRRQAVNHVADGLSDGQVRITSYHQLIRVAAAEDAAGVKARMITEDTGQFPRFSMHSFMVDVCRKDDGEEWRISARRVLRTVVNRDAR